MTTLASTLPVGRPLGTGPVRGRDVSPLFSGLSTEIFGTFPRQLPAVMCILPQLSEPAPLNTQHVPQPFYTQHQVLLDCVGCLQVWPCLLAATRFTAGKTLEPESPFQQFGKAVGLLQVLWISLTLQGQGKRAA